MHERVPIDDDWRRQVYALSLRHAPPKINLRDAEILDSYGDPSYADRHCRNMEHRIPDDVTKRDLDVFFMAWPFMNLTDRIFYLYSVASEYERNNNLDCVDSYLYNLNRDFEYGLQGLESVDRNSLLVGLKWLWNAGPIWAAAWNQCSHLLEALGVSESFDEISHGLE